MDNVQCNAKPKDIMVMLTVLFNRAKRDGKQTKGQGNTADQRRGKGPFQMIAKEYLRQYEELNKRAQRYRAEYVNELDKIDAIGSTLSRDAGMPHGTGISRKTEDKAIELAEAATAYKTAALQALEKRQEIFEVIKGVKGIEGDVLYERYINLRKWEEVCVLIHMSWNGTHKAHRRALAIVQQTLDNKRV